MGFLGHGRRHVEVRPEQKWDFISLNDFKATSCFTPLAYGYLWFSILLSMAVYAVDTFTAVNLLAFGRWASAIEPTQLISFTISRWIFSICIILSFLNLAYEHIRAQRIMRRGSVAESYLDNLAVRLESMRLGKGQGWRRFLVFAELTKSKKGAEYIALFTFFSFQSWVRVIVCSGPRQVINGLSLYSLYVAKLSIEGQNFENSLMSFFAKIKALGVQETLVLSGMLFTLVIWVFSFLSLLLAAVLYVFFLWHYIPREDGGLSGYCERKANKRLMKIVSIKINKAMAEDERRRKKAELKAAKKNGERRPVSMQATLPDVGGDDKLPQMPMLGRNDTMTTLPAYTSRPGTPGSFELNAVEQKQQPQQPQQPLPYRTATMSSSTSSFSARQPLVRAAADFGSSPAAPPSSAGPNRYPLSRTATASSGGSALGGGYAAGSASPYASQQPMPPMPPPVRSPGSPHPSYHHSNSSNSSNNNHNNHNNHNNYNNYGGPGANYPPSRMPGGGRATYDEYGNGPASPVGSYRGPQLPSPQSGPGGGSYPARSATNPVPPARGSGGGLPYAPRRNMTAPMEPRHQATGSSSSSLRNVMRAAAAPPSSNYGDYSYEYFERPATSNSQRGGGPPRQGYGNGWNQDVERGSGSRY